MEPSTPPSPRVLSFFSWKRTDSLAPLLVIKIFKNALGNALGVALPKMVILFVVFVGWVVLWPAWFSSPGLNHAGPLPCPSRRGWFGWSGARSWSGGSSGRGWWRCVGLAMAMSVGAKID